MLLFIEVFANLVIHSSKCCSRIISFKAHNPWRRYFHFPRFTNEKLEAQRGKRNSWSLPLQVVQSLNWIYVSLTPWLISLFTLHSPISFTATITRNDFPYSLLKSFQWSSDWGLHLPAEALWEMGRSRAQTHGSISWGQCESLNDSYSGVEHWPLL